jgi:hypothetical protein
MQMRLTQAFGARTFIFAFAALLACLVTGCPPKHPSVTKESQIALQGGRLEAVNLDDVSNPVAHDQPVVLGAAGNEWTNFTVQVVLPAPSGFWLQLSALTNGGSSIPISRMQAFQVLPMPVDMDRAGFVRHTGQVAARRSIPRALLTQPIDGNGKLNLGSLRNPLLPTDPRSHAGGPGAEPAMLWFDLHIPRGTPAGEYLGHVDLIGSDTTHPQATVPIQVTVHDFELPDERHLQMVGRLGWDRLEKLDAEEFETFTPAWVNRREARYQATIRTLDHLVSLAQQNRASLVIPALKPIVKWPAGAGPRIDWDDFDSMVRPWFTGDAFADHVGLAYWPLPEAAMLSQYDRASQLQYWTAAAEHFDMRRWLSLTAVSLELPGTERIGAKEASDLSLEAAEVLKCHPELRVLLPLHDDQVQLASANSLGVDPETWNRILTAGSSLVSASNPSPWKSQAPRHWLRTDLPGLVPYFGAGGDQGDVRVWAWLAFLGHLDTYGLTHIYEQNYILWNTTLPLTNGAEEAADPGELAWFYPGKWFGVDLPVPTVQLKWLRRAQQDYEYLLLAQERGQYLPALQIARLITKPVKLEASQPPDPAYALMTGTSNQKVWDGAQHLLAEAITAAKPGETIDPSKQNVIDIKTLQLSAEQEHQLLMARTTEWSIARAKPENPGNWIDLALGLDVYNAADVTPDKSSLRWTEAPAGWQIDPHEVPINVPATYGIKRASLHQQYNLDRVVSGNPSPVTLQFTDGFSQVARPLKFVLPVAKSDRHLSALAPDGQIADWGRDDIIQDGALVKMFDRPALQRQELQLASSNSTIYTTWSPKRFYAAFTLNGIVPHAEHTQNFVDYQQRRAWGEDLCELLIQPILANNRLGPAIHIVCKPSGGVWVERKSDTQPGDAGWRPLDAGVVRYDARTAESAWRGEVAIPWSVILNEEGAATPPTLLRFNFAQHKAATGESASWAGPVDFGRDETFMGLIYLRTADPNGINGGDNTTGPRSQ